MHTFMILIVTIDVIMYCYTFIPYLGDDAHPFARTEGYCFHSHI